MNKKLRWNRKGISIVIATIAIVAIAIVVSIAAAYWITGIGGSFTRFKKLRIDQGLHVANCDRPICYFAAFNSEAFLFLSCRPDLRGLV